MSRRSLLRGGAAALLAAPFVQLLDRSQRAKAAGTSTAKRLIVWFTPNGTVHRFWRPTGNGTSFDFAPGSMLEPLAAHKDKLVILDGLNFERVRGGSHEGGMEHMLTGGGAESIDQYIARSLGAATPYTSIELGVQTSAWGASIQTRMAYDTTHGFVHPEDDPVQAYARLFGGVSDMPGEADAQRGRRQSVLDLVRGELNSLNQKLGGEERAKLDAHLDALRELEKRVDLRGGAVSCGSLAAPSGIDARSNDDFPAIGDMQSDILVAAAACDLSRVLSLQWSHTVSPAIFSWAGAGEGHHELSHKDDSNAAGVQSFVDAERWLSEQFAAFLDKLAATPEADGSGSLLDTSLVVWAKELADGRLHDFQSVPFVLAGNANGWLSPGRYLKLDNVPHQKLLVSLCHAMGLPDTSFAVPDIVGAIDGLANG